MWMSSDVKVCGARSMPTTAKSGSASPNRFSIAGDRTAFRCMAQPRKPRGVGDDADPWRRPFHPRVARRQARRGIRGDLRRLGRGSSRDLQHAFRVWREPEYQDLRLEGALANSVPPWGLLAAPVTLAVKDPEHTPYCVSSSDPMLSRVLSQEWPHNDVLGTLPWHRRTSEHRAERGRSGYGLGRVYLQGEWRILVVTTWRMTKWGTGRLSYDPAAAERVRQLLSGRSDVVEKKMVGGLSFLVNGNMCCGITGMALMVRVGAESREQALREPHVRPMLFAGRALSGFICIEPAGYGLMMRSPAGCSEGSASSLGSRRSQSTRAADPLGPPGRHGNLGPRSAQQELRGRSLHSERHESAG